MTDQADPLVQFSNALATRAEASKNAVVAIRLAHERHITGMLWRSGIVVASEQSLPRQDEFEIVTAGGAAMTAKLSAHIKNFTGRNDILASACLDWLSAYRNLRDCF